MNASTQDTKAWLHGARFVAARGDSRLAYASTLAQARSAGGDRVYAIVPHMTRDDQVYVTLSALNPRTHAPGSAMRRKKSRNPTIQLPDDATGYGEIVGKGARVGAKYAIKGAKAAAHHTGKFLSGLRDGWKRANPLQPHEYVVLPTLKKQVREAAMRGKIWQHEAKKILQGLDSPYSAESMEALQLAKRAVRNPAKPRTQGGALSWAIETEQIGGGSRHTYHAEIHRGGVFLRSKPFTSRRKAETWARAQCAATRNPSSGDKQRARGVRRAMQYAPGNAGRDLNDAAYHRQRIASGFNGARWGSMDTRTYRVAAHGEAIARARSNRPALPNPSPAPHVRVALASPDGAIFWHGTARQLLRDNAAGDPDSARSLAHAIAKLRPDESVLLGGGASEEIVLIRLQDSPWRNPASAAQPSRPRR